MSSARGPRSSYGALNEVELVLQRTDTDPEDHPATAEHVQRAVALGQLEGMVVGEHEHIGRELDVGGARGEVAEGGERVPVARATAIELRGGQGDVLTARHVVVAEPIGGLGDARDVVDGGGDLPLTIRTWLHSHDGCADRQLDVHGCSLSPA